MRLISSPALTPIIGEWVYRHIHANRDVAFHGQYQAIGVMDGERLIAGVVYSDYSPEHQTIHATLAAESPRWATRTNIEGLFHYPFEEVKVQRITAMIKESNKRSLRLTEGVGFKREAVLERGAGLHENIIVLRMFNEEWRAGKYCRRQ